MPRRTCVKTLPRGLIITADDFGLAPEVNAAVELAHRQGVLGAASLMITGPAAGDAIARARRLPTLRVGLHVVLVESVPTSPPDRIRDLVNADGRLRDDVTTLGVALALRPSLRRQLRGEIDEQFSAFQRTGLQLDHVNAHKHYHVHPVVARYVLDAARRHGNPPLRVPLEPARIVSRIDGAPRASSQAVMAPWIALLRARARRAGVMTPDAVFGLRWSGAMTADRIGALIDHLPSGLVEIYTHPAMTNSFNGCAPGYRYTDELAALTAPAIIDKIRSCDLRPGGYLDAAALR
jgi:hopanoid biosynthesis associated protein HpnK